MTFHCTHLEVEHEPTPFVESLVRADDQLEVEQIVRIGEFRGARLGQIQLIDICQAERSSVQSKSISHWVVCLPFVILSWAAVKAFFWGPDFGVASPSFFCCFSENSLIILSCGCLLVVDYGR